MFENKLNYKSGFPLVHAILMINRRHVSVMFVLFPRVVWMRAVQLTLTLYVGVGLCVRWPIFGAWTILGAALFITWRIEELTVVIGQILGSREIISIILTIGLLRIATIKVINLVFLLDFVNQITIWIWSGDVDGFLEGNWVILIHTAAYWA